MDGYLLTREGCERLQRDNARLLAENDRLRRELTAANKRAQTAKAEYAALLIARALLAEKCISNSAVDRAISLYQEEP